MMLTNNTAGFLACLTGAAAMGLSCGTGCSPVISVFLGSYVFHAEGNGRNSAKTVILFFVGKCMAVLSVCMLASIIGEMLLRENGYLGKYQLKLLMPAFLIFTGIYMLKKCWKEFKNKGCVSCNGTCNHKGADHFKKFSPFAGGYFYGLTPCVPLVILSGYAVSMPIFQAVILGSVFSISCTLSPLILIMIFTNLIAVKMRTEVPELFRMMKAVLSMAVLVMGIVTCFTGIEPGLY